MRRKPIIAGVGVVALALLLFIAILFAVARQPSPAITVRHIKSVQSGSAIGLSFEISNHTANSYLFYPFDVELRTETAWKPCFRFPNDFRHLMPSLGPYAVTNCTFLATNLPTGAALRLNLHVQETLTGLIGFLRRVDLRLRHGPPMSLNPFHTSGKVFGWPLEIRSEEFVEPEPNLIGKGTSEK